jgi:phosphatidylglycerol:prolipoprotein diacylglycerol transferase
MYIIHHDINPVILSLGPINISWYGVSYVIGILIASLYFKKLNDFMGFPIKKDRIEDLLTYIVFGVVIGGRLGYVLFYNLDRYLANPVEILQTWKGGMSFHGGFLGVLVASFIFSKKHRVKFFQVTDLLACSAPIVIFTVRIANFINGELFGRPTDGSWGVVFPMGGGVARHPSQIYEAFAEGGIVFLITFYLFFYTSATRSKGFLSGVFMVAYAIMRISLENFREPDHHIGFVFSNVTMGGLLSLPMLIVGLLLILHSKKDR